MTTPVAPKTHIVIPHFGAITEFAPFRDDCGPCANEVCIAACERRTPLTANMDAIRARDLAHNPVWFRAGGGQTLDELADDAAQFAHMSVNKVAVGASLDAIHTALKDATLRGNPCVLNLALGGALPGNEANVHYHFVAVGGIDSDLGYLVANGDEFPYGHIGTYWVRWEAIARAQPIGLLEYHMPPPPPPAIDYAALYRAKLGELAQIAKIATSA